MSLTLTIGLNILMLAVGFWLGHTACRYSIKEEIRRRQLKEKLQKELENTLRRRALLKRLDDRSRRNASLRKKNASTHGKQS